MNEELKKKLDELGKAFEAFKAANDQRLGEIAAKGSASADVVAKVEAANADITKLRGQIETLTTQLRAQETLVARLEALGSRTENPAAVLERAHAQEFFSIAARRRNMAPPAAIGDPELEQYRVYGRGFRQYVRRGIEAVAGEIRAAMTVGTDPEGGYLVPPDLTGRVAQLVYETSPMRQFASVSTTSRKEKKGINDLDEAGGGWIGETAAPTESAAPKLGEWMIPVHGQFSEPRISQDELDDADFDVDGWLVRKIGDKLGRLEASANVVGNGIAKSRGFTTYGAGVPSASAWNVVEQVNTGAAGAFAAAPNGGDVFLTAIGKLKVAYRANARFAMNRTTEAETRKLKDSNGAYVWQPGLQAGTPTSLAGYPVALFEDLAAIAADSLSIAYADFRQAYEIVDRRGLTLIRDNLTTKPFIKFYTTRRVGGDVVNFEALKLIKFAA
jgi:HK97 family phage major capsid protein